MYFLDYLAAFAKVDFGAQGYAANFVLSVFDRDWKPDMTVDEGITLVKKCIFELHTRFLISQPKFFIKIVDKDGTRTLDI